MTDHNRHKYSMLPDLIDDLEPHDHLCLIYESREKWLETVVPFILSGLKRGEKCIYIVDANTARQVKTIFKKKGLTVDEYENRGQFSVVHERDTYTRGDFFDPDLMIAFLIEETEKALREGYSGLRVTGEMSWVLRGYSGAERVLEYEAKLNKDLFPAYPCVAICQYDRWKFDPETIKGVVMTHPLLIRDGQIYRNFYYIEPDRYLNHKKEELEVQHWLDNLEQERKTQESLRESEEKHRRLFETMAQGVIYQAADGKIVSANPSAEKILGLSFDEMQGKTSKAPRWKMIEEDGTAVPGDDHPAMIALRTGQKVGPVIRGLYRPDLNSHIWLNITAIPLYQPGETGPFQAYATFEDITAQKQTETALRESESKFRFLAENMTDVIWTADLELNYTYVSPSIEKLSGYSAEELLGTPGPSTLTPASLEKATEVFGEEMTAEQTGHKDPNRVITLELEHTHKDGSLAWVENNMAFIRDEDGKATGIFAVTRDITERKQAEKELQENRNLLSSVFESIQDGISILNTDLTIREVNQTIEKRHSHAAPFIGKKCYEVYQNRSAPCDPCPSIKALEKKAVCSEVVPLMGNDRQVLMNPLIDKKTGRVNGVTEFIRDITERKQAEEALRYHYEFVKMVSEIASYFINLPADQVDEGINYALKECGEFFQVEHSYILLLSPDGQSQSMTHEWHQKEAEPQINRLQDIPISKRPWWCAQLAEKGYVHLPDVNDIPEDAEKEGNEILSQNIKSLLSIPMFSGGKIIGHLGLDAIKDKKIWNEEQINLLKGFG